MVLHANVSPSLFMFSPLVTVGTYAQAVVTSLMSAIAVANKSTVPVVCNTPNPSRADASFVLAISVKRHGARRESDHIAASLP